MHPVRLAAEEGIGSRKATVAQRLASAGTHGVGLQLLRLVAGLEGSWRSCMERKQLTSNHTGLLAVSEFDFVEGYGAVVETEAAAEAACW